MSHEMIDEPDNRPADVASSDGGAVNRQQRSGWLLGLMALMLAFTLGFGFIYINRRVTESERRDCATLLADITAIEQGGQLTESGARVTLSRRDRYRDIGCDPHLPPPSYHVVEPVPAPSK